jgi:hypothetical protein
MEQRKQPKLVDYEVYFLTHTSYAYQHALLFIHKVPLTFKPFPEREVVMFGLQQIAHSRLELINRLFRNTEASG